MNEHDNFGGRLAQDLHTRADGLSGHPVSFDQVKRTAGRIRRRRAAATTAAVAVVAVGVPGGTWMAMQGDDAPDQQLVAAPTFHRDGPTPSLDPAGTGQGDRAGKGIPAVELDDLTEGEAPRRDWLQDRELHTADGRVIDLPASYAAIYRYDDGWLGVDYAGSDDGATAQVLDSDGAPVGEPFRSTGGASSADGSQLLYLAGDDLVLHDNETGTDTTIRTGVPAETVPVGVDDAGAVYYNTPVKNHQLDGRIWKDGAETDPSPGAVERLSSVNDAGFSTRMVEISDYGSCSAVFDPDGVEQARTCDFSVSAFSPDGTKVIAGPAYRDGFADLSLAVLGEDWASPVVERVNYGSSEEQGDSFTGSAWEDDEHLLVTMADTSKSFDRPTWYVVRLGLDGTAEIAAGPITVAEYKGVSLVR